MKSILFVVLAGILLVGCNSQGAMSDDPNARTEGSLKLNNLTPEQQIEKIRNDPKIPEGYKETYINSVRAKQGQAPVNANGQPAPNAPR